MNIAIVGGGINGLMAAEHLTDLGHSVSIFEKGLLCKQTSLKSSKMLHGGIRYLENYQFNEVKESLKCRHLWIKKFKEDIEIKRFFIPVYKNTRKSLLKLYAGVKLYDILSGTYSLGKSQFHSKKDFIKKNPQICSKDLIAGVSYFDAIMDDKSIIKKIIKNIRNKCDIFENNEIISISNDGTIIGKKISHKFDYVINACGPWASEFKESKISLDHIKGSHLILDFLIKRPILKVNEDDRVIFLLPFKNQTILGTTEIRHEIKNLVFCSQDEKDYLLDAANSILKEKISSSNIISDYSGVRPIVKSSSSYSKASRDSIIIKENKVISIYGGKWTSANVIGKKVNKYISG